MEPTPTLSLKDLFGSIPVEARSPVEIPDVAIQRIVFDSRQVEPGDLFVALAGVTVDGHRYIPAAIERGAAAVVGMRSLPEEEDWPVPYILVDDSRVALAHLSAAFYGFPGRKLTVIGVTGTDGKTTTTNLIYQILLADGIRAGMISTVNAVIGSEAIDTGFHVTTPEAPDVQRYLAQMVATGLTHAIVEATSHGLAQERVTAAEFDVAVVTNITHEHLDYHHTYEGYRTAKARLFDFLSETGPKAQGNLRVGVLNRDDGSYDLLLGRTQGREIAYSLIEGQGDLWAEDLRFEPGGTHFVVATAGHRFQVRTSLVGRFNAANCLAAAACTLLGLGLTPDAVQRGIEAMKGIPGRMERIDLGQNFTAIVDFAHTPNALRRALETARELTAGRVIAVFGSAGLRDREKRRMMAEVSIELADITVLTAEDPRTESLNAILAEMVAAAENRGGVEERSFYRVSDRGGAIRKAVALARPGDLVIACGKGHEQSMCFGETEYLWDDRTAMRAALAELLGVDGPQMPYLPTSETPPLP